MKERTYTITELQTLLGVAKSTIYAYILRGYVFPVQRINKRNVRFTIDAEALIQHFRALRREIPPQLLEIVNKVC